MHHDSSGKIFVLETNENKIFKLTPSGGHIPEFFLPGVNDPKNIAINSTDDILVTDNSMRKIFVFNNIGASKGSIDLSGNVTQLNGIAIIDTDDIFVSDWTPGFEKIIQVNNDGSVIGPPLTLDGIFSNPQDIATDGTLFWVTDNIADNKKIVQIRSDKGKIAEFNLTSTSPNFGISLEKMGDLSTILFTNSTQGKIYKLSTTDGDISELNDIGANDLKGVTNPPIMSRFLGIFVANGTGEIMLPSDITFGPDKNLYLGNRLDNTIKRYNGTTGAFIDSFVSVGNGELDAPRDIIFNSDGDLLVSSFLNNTVKLFNGTNGEFIEDFVSDNPLQAPSGLVFDNQENIC